MGRYFLAIVGADPLVDEEGSEFADDRLALGQAAVTAGELLRTAIAAPDAELVVRIDVADEHHRSIGTIEAKLSPPDQT